MNKTQMDYIAAYNRVAYWNAIAGNTNWTITKIDQQVEYVESEIGELEVSNRTLFESSEDKLEAIIDDIADIFVTASFLHYMTSGGLCPLYSMDLNHVDRLETYAYNELARGMTAWNALNRVYAVYEDFDIILAISKVMDSNFTKMIPLEFAGAIEDAKAYFDKELGACEYYIHQSGGFVTFKRRADDKIMKPANWFKKPNNLKECIFKGNNKRGV
jgi:hypothetical protein